MTVLRNGKKIRGLETNEKADSLVHQALDDWLYVCKRTMDNLTKQQDRSYNMGHTTLCLHSGLFLGQPADHWEDK